MGIDKAMSRANRHRESSAGILVQKDQIHNLPLAEYPPGITPVQDTSNGTCGIPKLCRPHGPKVIIGHMAPNNLQARKRLANE
jgi:hypothetical protein